VDTKVSREWTSCTLSSIVPADAVVVLGDVALSWVVDFGSRFVLEFKLVLMEDEAEEFAFVFDVTDSVMILARRVGHENGTKGLMLCWESRSNVGTRGAPYHGDTNKIVSVVVFMTVKVELRVRSNILLL